MARRDREINIFNIAFLDVITGAMGAFVLLVLLLAPYYTGSAPQSQAKREAAQSAVADAQQNLQKAQQSLPQNSQQAQQALAQALADLDQAKQQLDALKQQIDQLTSQNDRLNKLDQRQQQQIQQSTKEALARAEQNMGAADKAAQTGDIEELKRLLAQARADLAAAQKQLDELNQELKEAQDENAKLRQQLDQALSAVEDLRRQLEEARRQLSQALADRDRWKNYATGLSQTLDQSAPVPEQWVLVDAKGDPTCGNVDFTPQTHVIFSSLEGLPGLATAQQVQNYFNRGIRTLKIVPSDAQRNQSPAAPAPLLQGGGLAALDTVLNAQTFHGQYVLTFPRADFKLLFGFSATADTPITCNLAADFAMSRVNDMQNTLDVTNWGKADHVGVRPVLFAVISPGAFNPPAPGDIAAWNGATQSSGARR